jgi:hypothetical protein
MAWHFLSKTPSVYKPIEHVGRRGWFKFSPLSTLWLPRAPVVYVLYTHRCTVAYIGQTRDLRNRCGIHRHRGYVFGKARVIQSTDNRLELERKLIERIKPARNRTHTGRYNPRFVPSY